MKRLFLLALCLILLLSGCGTGKQDTRVLVYLEEVPGCTIENNGQWVLPGESAEFTLTFDYGLSLASTDYPGKTHTQTNGKAVTLTLEQVMHPTRVTMNLTRNYVELTYHSNGGVSLHTTQDAITQTCALNNHTRPNTDTGTDLFAREGYTLVCWNTKADGTGTRVGLGSRVSVPSGDLDLYAQWARWDPETDYHYILEGDTVTITGYLGNRDPIVVPEQIQGFDVTAIATGAFQNASAQTVILPKSMDVVEQSAFQNCTFDTLVLYDNIISISDGSFDSCDNLHTLYLNAIEAPFGYVYRKESCYADKVDLLINAQGHEKLVFYGGCSMWYNLDGFLVYRELGEDYVIINMGLNGTVNSLVQMQIIGRLLEDGDVFFHTPELSSRQQMMTNIQMLDTDKSLWCGLENNYDLFAYVDMTSLDGVFDSLCAYLDRKDQRTTYGAIYTGDEEQPYMDVTGSVPFFRNSTQDDLGDFVFLDPDRIDDASMARLKRVYDWYQAIGVRIYVSYACVNLDAVPEDQLDNLSQVEATFREAIEAMDGPVLISHLEEFVYHNNDFYDTNYHLRTEQTRQNTMIWLRDLLSQMERDGLYERSDP